MPRNKAPEMPDVAAPAVQTARSSDKTVTVACLVPNGLVLQLQREVEWEEETRNATIKRKRFDKVGKRYVVAGPAYPNGQVPDGFPDKPPIAGGYALTSGIPAEFWEQWLHQNRSASYVERREIFAASAMESVRDEAKELKDTRSGFEPIDRSLDYKKDPRLPGPVPGVGKVTQLDREATA